jgi:hypothetical protein
MREAGVQQSRLVFARTGSRETIAIEQAQRRQADVKCNPRPEGRRAKEKKSWNRSHVATCWQRPLPEVS